MSVVEIIISILSSSVVVSIITFFLTKKKYRAEVYQQNLENVDKAVAIYQKMLDDINERYTSLEAKYTELQAKYLESEKRNLELSSTINIMSKEMVDMKNKLDTMYENSCFKLNCKSRIRQKPTEE